MSCRSHTVMHIAIALVAAAFALVSLRLNAKEARQDFTVVIDPGHGAHDAGALGVKTNEKTINLKVALKLEKLIKSGMKDAKVVMTRDDDTFVPLQGRADIANRNKADVFISIHANSIDRKARNRTTIRGAAVYTLGLDRSETNLAVAMRENEVMKLEKDYTTTYAGFDPSSTESYIMFDIRQHAFHKKSISLAQEVQKELVSTAGRKNNGVKQAPFWVLVRTSMPAILVELDFICNPEMEKFMASDAGQKRLARAIYNGLRNYRRLCGEKVSDTAPAQEKEATEVTSEETEQAAEEQPAPRRKARAKAEPKAEVSQSDDAPVEYRIQFLTAGKRLKDGCREFKGVDDVDCYVDGGIYKFTTGHYRTMREASGALGKIRKKHPQAFVVKMQGDKRIR